MQDDLVSLYAGLQQLLAQCLNEWSHALGQSEPDGSDAEYARLAQALATARSALAPIVAELPHDNAATSGAQHV
ncbi:hypothetical protein [Chitinolyticbacter albus]|uniref:hypothetical protein n=1 Tax=Chitinolyticbacter albus TaxID=2961951 RepID=UPI00210C6B4B|nr:hypothetical protein [Chitinolyticbacter albus]